ncbi:MAG: TonB-dependent receptor plug domain-containing protein [Pseudomonadota bacterium]
MSARVSTFLSLICATHFNTASVWAEQPNPHGPEEVSEVSQILVTGSSLDATLENTGSDVSVLTEQDLKDGQYRNAIGALRQLPGVDVVQSGGNGGNAAVFLRGGNSEHTLVLLDGIELNNPATANRSFNMANLTLENIERIEVIRGPQSTIYGSDAMGGVINLISKKAKEGVHTDVSSEAGSYNSFTQLGNVSYGSDMFDVSTGVTRQDIGGVSAADARYGNKEQDDYQNTSLSNRLRFMPSKGVEATNTLRYTRSHANLDNCGGAGCDDPNRWIRNNELFTRGDVSAKLLDEKLTPAAYLSYTRHSLSDLNSPDAVSRELLDSDYNGDIVTLGSRLTWAPKRAFSTVIGGETQGERASSSYSSDGTYGPFNDIFYGREARTNSAYLESRISYEKKAHLDVGARHDNHSIFGGKTTFKAAPAIYLHETTKLRGSVGTGFKAPSLVQLYSSYGNRDLQAETSTGWDVGIDQQIIKDSLSTSVTFFRTNFDELITFNSSTFVLENINKATTQGFEVGATHEMLDDLSLRAAYTYTDTENTVTGEGLLRRPRNKGSLTAVYSPTDRLRAQLQWRVYSSRFDSDFNASPPERISLGGYGIVDLAVSYQLLDSVELFGRVDNLFDKEYQDVLGFGTMGAAAYAGVRVEL